MIIVGLYCYHTLTAGWEQKLCIRSLSCTAECRVTCTGVGNNKEETSELLKMLILYASSHRLFSNAHSVCLSSDSLLV